MGYVMDLVNRFQNLRQKPPPSDDEEEDEQVVEETYTFVWRTNGDQQDMIEKLSKLYPFRKTNTRRHSTSVTDCVQHIIGCSQSVRRVLEPGCDIHFRLLKPDNAISNMYSQSSYCDLNSCYYSSEQSRIELVFDSCFERLYEELFSLIGILAIGHDSSGGFRNPTSDYAIALHRGSWHRAKIIYTVSNLVTVRLLDNGVRCVVNDTGGLVPIPMKYVTCLPPKSVLCNSKWKWSEDNDSVVLRGRIVSSNLEKWYESPHFDEPRLQIDDSPNHARPKSFAFTTPDH